MFHVRQVKYMLEAASGIVALSEGASLNSQRQSLLFGELHLKSQTRKRIQGCQVDYQMI